MIDKKYVSDFRLWIKEMRLKALLLKNDAERLQVDIALSKQQLALANKRVKFIASEIKIEEKKFKDYLRKNK